VSAAVLLPEVRRGRRSLLQEEAYQSDLDRLVATIQEINSYHRAEMEQRNRAAPERQVALETFDRLRGAA